MRLLLLCMLLAAIPAPARAADAAFGDIWYGAVRAGVIASDQDYDNDGTLYGVAIGRTYGPDYAVELEINADEMDFGIDYGLRHRSIGLNHMTINREPLWDPYFLIGVGLIEFDAPPGVEIRSGHDVMFNLGIGGQWELVVPQKVLLRADLRVRYDLNDTRQPGQNGFGDGVLSVGLVVPFGSAH